jgi:hypothetical protein
MTDQPSADRNENQCYTIHTLPLSSPRVRVPSLEFQVDEGIMCRGLKLRLSQLSIAIGNVALRSSVCELRRKREPGY